MPQISRFFGIIIAMYFDEHNPPHFHAIYQEYEAEISINGFKVLNGNLPPRALGLVTEWANIHRTELTDNWDRIQEKQPPRKIKPLE